MRMETKRSKQASLLLWTIVASLLSQNFVVPVMSAINFEDQKTYYSPDPNTQTPPSVSYSPPPHGSGGGHATPTPSHGPPSHGGGSYGGTPPGYCGNPPSGGHHPTTPSPPRGGGYHSPPTPIIVTPPSGGYYDPPPTSTPTTPSTPTPIVVAPPTGGYYDPPPTSTPTRPSTPTPIVVAPPTGGYYNPPPTPIVVSPPTPTTPIDPGTPSTPIYPGTPSTPIDPGTPSTPIYPGIPSTPGITIPSPPFPFDPNSPPFTCIYWRNHPTLVWGLLGWWGTVGNVFGVPGFGSNMNLLQALSNPRTDGYGHLYREGTAALLNSMAHARFPYTTTQVRDSFAAALRSNRAAATQAHLFKLANEGRTKPRA